MLVVVVFASDPSNGEVEVENLRFKVCLGY